MHRLRCSPTHAAPSALRSTARLFFRFTALMRAQQSVTFRTASLPPQLQAEFDEAANQSSLSYLARGGKAPAVVIDVLPNWAHRVMWRCSCCAASWAARPSDRLDPQVSALSNCPRCATHAPHDEAAATKRGVPVGAPVVDVACAGASTTPPLLPLSQLPPGGRPRNTASRLVNVYPTIASQWDLRRNSHPQNRVAQPLESVSTSSTAKVWWDCSLCCRPWQEAVSSRVARHEALIAGRGGDDQLAKEFVSLCPSCDVRGAVDRVNGDAPPAAAPPLRLMLSQDSLLMAEARLRPDMNPAEISLHSETTLSWQCRYCDYGFEASVAARHHRHERCPQCSGCVRTPLNLLVIQRPDVVAEVSKAISRTRLRYITVQDAAQEIPFVCRTCWSPYRMTARARCAVPAGGAACPKCVLALSQAVSTAPLPSASLKPGGRGQRPRARLPPPSAGQHGGGRTRLEQRRIKQVARDMSLSGRNGEHLAASTNDLRKRDKALRN